jgi:hypothetical protein
LEEQGGKRKAPGNVLKPGDRPAQGCVSVVAELPRAPTGAVLTVTVRETDRLRVESDSARVIADPLGGAWAPESSVKSKLKDWEAPAAKDTRSTHDKARNYFSCVWILPLNLPSKSRGRVIFCGAFVYCG